MWWIWLWIIPPHLACVATLLCKTAGFHAVWACASSNNVTNNALCKILILTQSTVTSSIMMSSCLHYKHDILRDCVIFLWNVILIRWKLPEIRLFNPSKRLFEHHITCAHITRDHITCDYFTLWPTYRRPNYCDHITVDQFTAHSVHNANYSQYLLRMSSFIRYDTRCYFNVRSKADISQLNLPHGTDN